MELQQYKDWSPTQFDSKGLGCEDRQDWFVCPVIETRDSGHLEKSNFTTMLCMLEEIDPEEETWETHSFNHWGPGYFTIILVKPDSAAYNRATEAANALEYYPVLDESDLSDREFEGALSDWELYGMKEFCDLITPDDCDLDDYPDISLEQFQGWGGEIEFGDETVFNSGWVKEDEVWEEFKKLPGVEYEFVGEHDPVPIRQFFDSQAIAWFVGLNEEGNEGNLVSYNDEVIGRAFESKNLWTVQSKDGTYNSTGIDLYELVEDMIKT
jgi:hypothetical protein